MSRETEPGDDSRPAVPAGDADPTGEPPAADPAGTPRADGRSDDHRGPDAADDGSPCADRGRAPDAAAEPDGGHDSPAPEPEDDVPPGYRADGSEQPADASPTTAFPADDRPDDTTGRTTAFPAGGTEQPTTAYPAGGGTERPTAGDRPDGTADQTAAFPAGGGTERPGVASDAGDESPTTNLGGNPPPGGGYGGTPPPPPPPPGGAGTGWADEPPPITGFARRHRLVRPAQGRKLAGVCAGFGRATDTDPVLWRVILAVLVFFGGVGLLAYVVGWLCMPRDDDQVAPVESLVGRGRSSTSPLLTVLLGLAGIGLVFFVFNSGFRAMVLVMGVAVVIAVVLTRRNQSRADGAPATAGAGAPPGGTAPQGTAPGGTAPQGTAPGSTTPYGTAAHGVAPEGTAATGGAWQPATGGAAPTAGYRVTPGYPTAPNYTVPPTAAQQPGYRPPFAPHGPYGPGTASPLGAGEVPIGGMLPPPPPPPYRKPPKPPKQKSILGRLTFFVLCLAIGALAVLAAAGVHVPASAFFALSLVVLGGGLVVGAWRGRARWLIILGCVFALALPIAWVAENERWSEPMRSPEYVAGDQHWTPTSVQSLREDYTGSVGDATLDLSNVDFRGAHRSVSVHNSVGDVKVLLPSDVDVTVTLEPGLGDATLFGHSVVSPHNRTEQRIDLGPDGRGGGSLDLQIKDNAGDVEVTR